MVRGRKGFRLSAAAAARVLASPSSSGGLSTHVHVGSPSHQPTDNGLGIESIPTATILAISHPSTEAPLGAVSKDVEPDLEDDGDNGVLPRIQFDYNTSGGEEEPDNRNRTRIRPIGNSFEDSRVVLGAAYSDIRAHYNGSWTCWSEVPDEEKDFWWIEFEGRYFWKDKHSAQVKENWRFKCNQYLRSVFCESRPSTKRPTYKRPYFVHPDKWLEMKDYFESEEFKQRSETNKRNRASEERDGSAIYTGGSKSVVQHVSDYEIEHGKPMSMEKLMEKTYRKKDGTWAGERAQIVLKRNKELHDKFVEQHPEGVTQRDVDKLWLQAAGGKGKSSVFGGGALYSSTPNFRNPAARGPVSSISTNINTSELEEMKKKIEEDLRKKIEEGLRKKIEEEVQKTMEARMQTLLMQQRDEDAIKFQRLLDMQLSRYVHPSPPIDTSFHSLLNSTTHMYASPSLPTGPFSLYPSRSILPQSTSGQLHPSTYFDTSQPSLVASGSAQVARSGNDQL